MKQNSLKNIESWCSRKVLFFDNDKNSCILLRDMLKYTGLVITICKSINEFKTQLEQSNDFSLLLFQVRLLEINGLEVLIKENFSSSKLIILSSIHPRICSKTRRIITSMSDGKYILEPFSAEDLIGSFSKVLA